MPPWKITSGFLALSLVSTALKSVSVSVVVALSTTVILSALSFFSTSAAQALAVGGLVVDQGDFLRFQLAGDIGCQRRALLVVAADSAEHAFEAALR